MKEELDIISKHKKNKKKERKNNNMKKWKFYRKEKIWSNLMMRINWWNIKDGMTISLTNSITKEFKQGKRNNKGLWRKMEDFHKYGTEILTR